MPIAREAHDLLDFTDIKVDENRGHPLARGVAVERPGKVPLYANWSVGVVRSELIKGGWRLAAMLQKVVPTGPGATGAAAGLTPPTTTSATPVPAAATLAEGSEEDMAKAPEE